VIANGSQSDAADERACDMPPAKPRRGARGFRAATSAAAPLAALVVVVGRVEGKGSSTLRRRSFIIAHADKATSALIRPTPLVGGGRLAARQKGNAAPPRDCVARFLVAERSPK